VIARRTYLLALLAVALLAARRALAQGTPAGLQSIVTAPAPQPATPRADPTAAASVVSPADSPHAYDDLGSLLLQVPGVTVSRTGSAAAFSTIALRGSNPDEVLIYLDGVPLNIAEGGGVDISTLPLGDVDRVEVYRGTTPLVFAESALGGVVSISTRTPAADRLTARAGVGSFRTLFGDATAGGLLGRLRLYVGAHVLSSRGDYPYRSDNLTPLNPADDYDTTRGNNDSLEGNGVIRAALTLAGRRTLTLGLVGFGREQGLQGPTNGLTIFTRFHTLRGLGTLRYESRDDLGPGGRLSVVAFASVERDRLLDPKGEVWPRGPLIEHATTLSTGALAHASRPVGEWGRFAAVLEARRETYTPENELDPAQSGVPARRLVAVAGGEVDLAIRPLELHLVPSVRTELLRDVVSGESPQEIPLPAAPAVVRLLPIYRLGLLRPLGQGGAVTASLKANLGRYTHAPSFLELYGAGDQRLLGNPALVPERGTNADLALWIDGAGRRASISSRTTLFGARADDLIAWIVTNGGPSRAENISAARIYGVEQELRLGLGRHARLVAQGTITVAQDQSDTASSRGRQLPHHPRYLGYVRPEAARLPLAGTWELAAYADATLLAGDYDDPANLVPAPSRALIGAGATLCQRRARLCLTASGYNLANVPAWDLTTWPLPGRSFFVTLAFDSAAEPDAPALLNP
jgi:outer membrane receptor protein involved in Fe transport